MKKFTKLFLSCAALAALTAAVATSAMAAEVEVAGDVTGKYDTDTGKLTITAPADIDSTKEATFVVYAASVDDTNLTADDIVGIDQATNAAFAQNGLKGTPQESGDTLKVKVGYYTTDGTFTILEGTLFSKGEAVKIGNTNPSKDDVIDGTDALYMSRYLAEFTDRIGQIGEAYVTADGKDYTPGNTNPDKDSVVDGTDALYLSRYLAEFTDRIGQIGETVTVSAK